MIEEFAVSEQALTSLVLVWRREGRVSPPWRREAAFDALGAGDEGQRLRCRDRPGMRVEPQRPHGVARDRILDSRDVEFEAHGEVGAHDQPGERDDMGKGAHDRSGAQPHLRQFGSFGIFG